MSHVEHHAHSEGLEISQEPLLLNVYSGRLTKRLMHRPTWDRVSHPQSGAASGANCHRRSHAKGTPVQLGMAHGLSGALDKCHRTALWGNVHGFRQIGGRSAQSPTFSTGASQLLRWRGRTTCCVTKDQCTKFPIHSAESIPQIGRQPPPPPPSTAYPVKSNRARHFRGSKTLYKASPATLPSLWCQLAHPTEWCGREI